MKQYELNKYLNDLELVEQKILKYLQEKIIVMQKEDIKEIKGHLLKSEHNLKFVKDNIKLNYLDWAIIGCYYASYHVALALIMTKNYSSKNHFATFLILVKEFYNNGLSENDFKMLAHLLDYQDILFYVESKNKREDAAYSTKTKYNKQEVEQLRMKSALFISKIKLIIEDKNLNHN